MYRGISKIPLWIDVPAHVRFDVCVAQHAAPRCAITQPNRDVRIATQKYRRDREETRFALVSLCNLVRLININPSENRVVRSTDGEDDLLRNYSGTRYLVFQERFTRLFISDSAYTYTHAYTFTYTCSFINLISFRFKNETFDRVDDIQSYVM